MYLHSYFFFFFFFNDTATTEIYTLSLHDALPIYNRDARALCDRPFDVSEDGRLVGPGKWQFGRDDVGAGAFGEDRKSTRLNSSHQIISYAVFCLKKKKRD